MEHIFIEGKTRPVGAPSLLALVPALLVHLALLPFALLSFNPPLFEEAPPVENPAIDPYAPDDTSYENPINDIRDPIPGVIHN